MIASLWRYRGFVRTSVARDFQLRYRGSALGIVWTLLQPIGTVVVLTIGFTRVMQPRLPGGDGFTYSIYLCAGVFAWGLFAEIVQRELNVFIENGNYLKKSSFPRSSLPLIVAITAIINFVLAFAIYFVLLFAIDRVPGWVALWTLPVILMIALLAVGLGILLGTANVFFRDLGPAVPIVLQFWFWLTPIVYVFDTLPEFARHALKYNPLHPLMAAYQNIFLSQRLPDFSSLAPLAVLTGIFLLLGARFFLSRVGELVDEL